MTRARRSNNTTKNVVSSTPASATWNSTIVGPCDPTTVPQVKDKVDGDIYVSGSGTLVRALLADGLVDERHLCLYPLTRGPGPRLFAESAPPGKWSLATCKTYDNGVLHLHYRS